MAGEPSPRHSPYVVRLTTGDITGLGDRAPPSAGLGGRKLGAGLPTFIPSHLDDLS